MGRGRGGVREDVVAAAMSWCAALAGAGLVAGVEALWLKGLLKDS